MGIHESAMGVAVALLALASSLLAFVIVVLCKCLNYFTRGDKGSAERTLDFRRHASLPLHDYWQGLHDYWKGLLLHM